MQNTLSHWGVEFHLFRSHHQHLQHIDKWHSPTRSSRRQQIVALKVNKKSINLSLNLEIIELIKLNTLYFKQSLTFEKVTSWGTCIWSPSHSFFEQMIPLAAEAHLMYVPSSLIVPDFTCLSIEKSTKKFMAISVFFASKLTLTNTTIDTNCNGWNNGQVQGKFHNLL